MNLLQKAHPSNVSADELELVAPYMTLVHEDVGQRTNPLREVLNEVRYVVKTGTPWRWMPSDLPPSAAIYQQAHRWLSAGCTASAITGSS